MVDSRQPDSLLRERTAAFIAWLRRRIIWEEYGMTSAERDRWSRIRSKGLAAYKLKHFVLFALGVAVPWAVIEAIFSRTVDRHALKLDLIEGGALGGICGFLFAYNTWFRNQLRYLKKHSPKRRIY